jgi:hypothetical protein
MLMRAVSTSLALSAAEQVKLDALLAIAGLDREDPDSFFNDHIPPLSEDTPRRDSPADEEDCAGGAT